MRKILFILLAMAGVQGSRAQLTAEIDVERTVVPRLQLQAPLPSVVPAVIPSSEAPMRLSLSEYSGDAAGFTSAPGGLLGASYTGLAARSPYRGYIWGGYFPAYNLGIGAGYRFIRNETTSLGAALQFDGSSYNAHLPEGARESVKDNTVGLQADFSHAFSEAARIGAAVSYSHAALTAPTLATAEQAQKIDDFKAALSFDGRKRLFAYGVRAGIVRFALGNDIAIGENEALTPPAETVFDLAAGIRGTSADSIFRYSLEAGLDMKHRSGNTWKDMTLGQETKANPMIVSLDPTVGFQFGSVGIDLGANVDISSNLDGSSFHVAPVVNVAWTPSGRFAFFARSKGGASMTDLRTLYNYSPFAPGAFVHDAAFSPVDSRAGFTFGPFGGFTAEIYGRYASTRRAPMLAVAAMPQESLLAGFLPANIKGWGAGLRLGWSCRVASVAGAVEVLEHGVDKGFADAPDRAAIVAMLSAKVRPVERISLEAAWDYRGKRAYAYGSELISMRNISSIDLGAEYAVSDRMNAFIRFENILARRPEILPGLTANGLHGLAGVLVRF